MKRLSDRRPVEPVVIVPDRLPSTPTEVELADRRRRTIEQLERALRPPDIARPLDQPATKGSPMKRVLLIAALAALSTEAAAFPTGDPGSADARVRKSAPETQKPNPADIGAFRTGCAFSHMANDDPIVFPGQPGKSHLHVFFGNTNTNSRSTYASLGRGASTCRGGSLNRSAYWAPGFIDQATGQPVKPKEMGVYYKTGYGGVKPADVKPFPPGLRMVAGDMRSSAPQAMAGFFCLATGINSKELAACPAGSELWAVVTFPQCWDGKNLDSPDHKSHMSYPSGGCPKTHPVALPEVTFHVVYIVPPEGVATWRLSSDMYDPALPAGYSMHGDWLGHWNRATLNAWVKNCNNTSTDCHSDLLGNGQELY